MKKWGAPDNLIDAIKTELHVWGIGADEVTFNDWIKESNMNSWLGSNWGGKSNMAVRKILRDGLFVSGEWKDLVIKP